MLSAGVASFDMSPPKGLELAGYPHHPRHNQGIHDPLMGSCLYLSNRGVELFLISLDILFFSKKYVREARGQIEQATGVPGEHILICCSHTHSGPWASGRLDLEALKSGAGVDESYVQSLIRKIMAAAVEARACSFAASIGVGIGRCAAEHGVGGNRRIKGGISDPDVGVIAIKDAGGRLRGMWLNYALHPTFIHEDSALVSADYPGHIRKAALKRYPGMVFGFAQGASGDQSSRYFRQGQSHEEAERVANALWNAALPVLENMDCSSDPLLSVECAEVALLLRDYPPLDELKADMRRKAQEYESLKRSGAPYLEIQNANLRMLGAEDLLGFAMLALKGERVSLLHDESPAEVQRIGIGNACVVALPGECFVEYALQIKRAAARGPALVFTLANGCLPGYCYTPDALESGGYEVDTSMLAPEFGDALTQCAIAMVRHTRERG